MRAALAGFALVLLTPARPAGAHPIDEYLQQAYLTPAPSGTCGCASMIGPSP